MSPISVFFILLVAVFATLAYFTEPTEAEKRIQERLSGLDRPLQQGEDDHTEIVKRVTFSKVAWVDRYLRDNKVALKLQLMLEQAKVGWTVGRFFFYSACAMLVGAVVGNWWLPVGFIGWIPGLVLGVAPLCWIMYKRSQRFRRFNELLPDAIDLISRSLRAGHALPSALVTVGEELAEPLGPEFQHCADEMSYGLPFREAMHNMMRRFPLQDLNFLVSAILVQRETGGNLAELLDKAAAVLRARITLQQKVRVHTAQGRMTGAILIAMPFVAFVLLNLIKPGYTAPLFETDAGHKLVIGTLISITLGALSFGRLFRLNTKMNVLLMAIFLAVAVFAAIGLIIFMAVGERTPAEVRLAELKSGIRSSDDSGNLFDDFDVQDIFSALTRPLAPFRDWLRSRDDESRLPIEFGRI